MSEISSENRFRSASPALRERVLDEQVRSLYAVTRYAFRTSLVFAVLVYFYFLGRVPTLWLSIWLASVGLIAVARFLASRRFFDEPGAEARRAWVRLACVSMTAQACSWLMVLLFVEQTGAAADASMAVFLLCALAFGGFAVLGFYLPAYLSFAAPIFLGLWVWFGWTSISADWFWLMAVVAFGSLAIIGSAVGYTRILRGTLLLGYQHEDLIRRLTEEKERVQVTLRSIGDAVLTTDVQGRVTYVNPVAERLTGWRNEEAWGKQLEEVLHLIHDGGGERITDVVSRCLEREGLLVLEDEISLEDRRGERESTVEVTASPIRGYDRQIMGVVVVAHDVTELRGMARVMNYQAQHDPLTGLLNRREFEASLWHALESARREKLQHAVCYLDLDQFKLVNDTCGHSAGDELIKQVGVLLHRRVSESDTLARLGGDEFGLLLHDCGLERARVVAEEFCEMMRSFRFDWQGKLFNINVSIGVVLVDGTSSPSDLLAAADAACYVAKDQGRSRVHVVLPHDRELAHRHGEMQWVSRIQQALDEGRFVLRYQRIVPLRAGENMVEMLVSMIGPHQELVPPGSFLPAAERFNLVTEIDRRVVRMVLERLAAADTVLAEMDVITINLSGQSVNDESFLDYVLATLDDTGADPQRICFEITETAVIAHMERAERFIQALRERGCRFALDDFGSGISSFGYLRALSVDYLKIDGMFVKNMVNEPVDRSMVEAIHQVGHVMGIETIAEFVEDEETRQMLEDLGVNYGQGFGLHRPEFLDKDVYGRIAAPQPTA
ncbi:EAL domain-containing protein [Alkalilimnicola sp. S0819]|uniref:EAL domain-containing protein n=1 Tax=Alkalilimnicola sp. S0819 TaxID=2613922 RepID=UPI00186A32A2|nr:EAL domain-containing protein [Alkalilimnicola sp. S0819]